jgi:GAF domain-containing protein
MTMNVGIEDFTQLDAYHGLLPALARALDVHDIFQQLSAAAARIVPHDVANLFLRVDDTDNFRLYASTDADYELVYFDRVKAIHGDDLRQPRVHESASVGSDRGMQSALTAPVQINDQFFGLFGLASRQRQAYSDRDILHAQRLASYLAVAVSHQRLSEQARDAALHRPASLDGAGKCHSELCRNCVRWARKQRRTPAFTASSREVFQSGKSLN